MSSFINIDKTSTIITYSAYEFSVSTEWTPNHAKFYTPFWKH